MNRAGYSVGWCEGEGARTLAFGVGVGPVNCFGLSWFGGAFSALGALAFCAAWSVWVV